MKSIASTLLGIALIAAAMAPTNKVGPTRQVSAAQDPMEVFFAAIRQAESSGNDRAIGDNGSSLGPYQISLAYWIDGGGDPKRYKLDVWDPLICQQVMLNYWRRYCPKALENHDWETLARVHNGGPNGRHKQSTLKYWEKICQLLNNK